MATGNVSTMTSAAIPAGLKFFYLDGTDFTIMGFAVNPQIDTNAPAQMWFPKRDGWDDVPGLSAGSEAVWGSDWHQIDESQVPAMQQKLRTDWAAFKARK